jgi:hypothetical protein
LIVTAPLVPVLLAIWLVPGFITQDGPAHLYNAAILADSFVPQSPYHAYYEVRWQPLPNWAGHLALAGLLWVVSPWVADRILMTATLAGFAASLVWLRWKVRGGQAMLGPCLLAALLSMNYLWLLGFTSFLLGSCLFAVTLGVWWSGRDRLGSGHLVAIMALLVLGYFGHLVSLGLTVLGLVVLAAFAPLPAGGGGRVVGRLRRLGRTAICCMPLVPLGLIYLRLSRRGGPMHPVWENLADPYSPAAWVARLGWVDPLTLAMKAVLPFTDRAGWGYSVCWPVLWFVLAGMSWWAGRMGAGSSRDREVEGRRDQGVWIALSAVMMLAGFVGPDSLGPGHGEYLPQRWELLGLAALVPAFDLELAKGWGRMAATCLVLAVVLQAVVVWDYALYSERTAGQIMRVGDLVGQRQRIATLLARIRSRFRANPLLHADCWLGVGTGSIVWSNYETRHYYFPVQFRAGVDRPASADLEWLAIHDDPSGSPARAELWSDLLSAHAGSIDAVLLWRDDPALEAITEARFDLAARRGDVRVYMRRDSPIHEAPAASSPVRRLAAGPTSASSDRSDRPHRRWARSPWGGRRRGGRPRPRASRPRSCTGPWRSSPWHLRGPP